MKDRKSIVTNGRAAFYASIYGDLRQAALDCGWALGLHGSLNADMDIMAMAWTEDAKPVKEMICSLENCLTEPDKMCFVTERTLRPNNRVVYTIHIYADYYLDINVIEQNKKNKNYGFSNKSE